MVAIENQSMYPIGAIPALFTTAHKLRFSSAASFSIALTSFVMSSSFVTSQTIPNVTFWFSLATPSSVRHAATTLYPQSDNSMADSAPNPESHPVINTILLETSGIPIPTSMLQYVTDRTLFYTSVLNFTDVGPNFHSGSTL